jgi:signal transduction histidine kinase
MNDLIAERYAVISTLGEGGGGAVCRVLDQARGIATALGGRLWAESAGLDQGSRFVVVLPEIPAEEGDDGQA